MNERDYLLTSLDSVDLWVLNAAVINKLNKYIVLNTG